MFLPLSILRNDKICPLLSGFNGRWWKCVWERLRQHPEEAQQAHECRFLFVFSSSVADVGVSVHCFMLGTLFINVVVFNHCIRKQRNKQKVQPVMKDHRFAWWPLHCKKCVFYELFDSFLTLFIDFFCFFLWLFDSFLNLFIDFFDSS